LVDSPRATLRHVPALDGLRGIALLGVLFFHANNALPGGFLGVDLFFVLSGFLITSLLLAEHEQTGGIALSSFWVRRARRLFPALLSLMPAIALYGRFIAKPDELAGLRADALATLGYVANWRTIFSHKSYWELFQSPSPLEHTWSLSIEEQFYVVWPLVVVALLRQSTRRAVLAVALVLIAASITATLVLFDPAHTSRVYLGTDTRAAGILAGAALATLKPQESTFSARAVRVMDVLGVVALIGLGAAWWKLTGESVLLYHGGLWGTEVLALVLVVCAMLGRRTLVGRALSWPPLTLLGTISYGVYLWHWPVNVVLTPGRIHARGAGLHAIQFAITLAIASVSYRFLERPIRQRGVPFGRPIYMVPAAVALSVLLIVRATYARPSPPLPQLPPASPVAPSASDRWPPRLQVMVLGDSTANSLGWGLRGLQQPRISVELRGQNGCTMLGDLCGGPSWATQTKEVHPDATILMLGGAFMHGIGWKGAWVNACHNEWDTKFESALEKQLGDLLSPDGRVWVATVPYPLGTWEGSATHDQTDCINTSIRKARGAVAAVRILDLAEHLCPQGVCELEYDGKEIRPDGVHYDIAGAHGLSTWILEQIQL
jgi:peptidoglycan/LPS O-acetylase OafA/YrhL